MSRKQSDNLIPASQRSKSEVRKIGQKGGIASGESRRRKKSMSELAKAIANGEVKSEKNRKQLEALGIESDDMQNAALITAGIFHAAIGGNMNAVDKWQELTEGNDAEDDIVLELPARHFGRAFHDIDREIKPNVKYVFRGGRGGLKSSFISLKIVELIINNPEIHACVIRKVAATLRDSVFAQMLWAINTLHLTDKFKVTTSPLQITYIKTGQHIYFRGCDDPKKQLKSIKPPFGHIGIMWAEEADQLNGVEELRNAEQSLLRGKGDGYEFISYNPPKSKDNWVNREEHIPDERRIIHTSCYTEAPPEWLGERFINDAEHLREVNPAAYEHEYLGVPNGSGGNVFDALEIRAITDEEVERFDNIRQGVDWGWYPDQYAFLRTHYDAARERIYLIDELYVNKQSNAQTAEWILQRGYNDFEITCDSEDPKSVNDYRDMGLPARGAVKGAGSVDYGFKWLQCRTLVIDPARTPNAYNEIINYEYERDKEGNVISGYPDGNDHAISALRYAYEPVFKRRGSNA